MRPKPSLEEVGSDLSEEENDKVDEKEEFEDNKKLQKEAEVENLLA